MAGCNDVALYASSGGMIEVPGSSLRVEAGDQVVVRLLRAHDVASSGGAFRIALFDNSSACVSTDSGGIWRLTGPRLGSRYGRQPPLTPRCAGRTLPVMHGLWMAATNTPSATVAWVAFAGAIATSVITALVSILTNTRQLSAAARRERREARRGAYADCLRSVEQVLAAASGLTPEFEKHNWLKDAPDRSLPELQTLVETLEESARAAQRCLRIVRIEGPEKGIGDPAVALNAAMDKLSATARVEFNAAETKRTWESKGKASWQAETVQVTETLDAFVVAAARALSPGSSHLLGLLSRDKDA